MSHVGKEKEGQENSQSAEEPSEKPWFKFWPEGVRKHIDFPEVPLHGLLEGTAEKFPEHTAIVYFNKTMTYRELNDLSDRFATALDDLGVKKGDKVAIFLPNTPQFVISYYGITKIGAVETAISPLYKEREVEHQLNDSEAETVVVLDALLPHLRKGFGKHQGQKGDCDKFERVHACSAQLFWVRC